MISKDCVAPCMGLRWHGHVQHESLDEATYAGNFVFRGTAYPFHTVILTMCSLYLSTPRTGMTASMQRCPISELMQVWGTRPYADDFIIVELERIVSNAPNDGHECRRRRLLTYPLRPQVQRVLTRMMVVA